MDIEYTTKYDIATLTAGIVSHGLPQGERFFGVSVYEEGTGKTVVHLPDDATPEERAVVQTAIDSYDEVGVLKTQKLNQLHEDCTAYIFDHYDTVRQASLNALLTEGVIQGWPNRIGYIAPALSWIKSVITYYYNTQDSINSSTTKSDLDSVQWTFESQFDSTDPQITLRQAQSITN